MSKTLAQPDATNAAAPRARLNALPALIEAANKQGGRAASQALRGEKAGLEQVVPVVERSQFNLL